MSNNTNEFEQEVEAYKDLILQKVESGKTSPEWMERMANEAGNHPDSAIRQGYAAAWATYQQQEGKV
jgi:hypothetical protein